MQQITSIAKSLPVLEVGFAPLGIIEHYNKHDAISWTSSFDINMISSFLEWGQYLLMQQSILRFRSLQKTEQFLIASLRPPQPQPPSADSNSNDARIGRSHQHNTTRNAQNQLPTIQSFRVVDNDLGMTAFNCRTIKNPDFCTFQATLKATSCDLIAINSQQLWATKKCKWQIYGGVHSHTTCSYQ